MGVSSRCGHTAAVVDPKPDDLVGRLGLPGRLLPAAAAAVDATATGAI